jgi:hypothetical protein
MLEASELPKTRAAPGAPQLVVDEEASSEVRYYAMPLRLSMFSF